MITLSQNKKILITAISIFVVSFIFFLLFFENAELNKASLHTSTLKLTTSHTPSKTVDDPQNIYTEYINDDRPWFSTSVEGEFVYLSDEFCELMDKECSELEGKLLYHYINTKDLPELVSENSRLFQEKEKVEAMGPFRLMKDGTELIMLFDAIPLSDEEDKLTEILFSVKDLTEQVEDMRDTKRNWMKSLELEGSEKSEDDKDTENSEIPTDDQDLRLMVKGS
ncbi:PAS domain S-box protein [Candidatus Peregrinibacteria bacterium]|nr:PAS domain S-box protein [Candidatus Peregrinibacteria bacterium]